MHKTPPSCSGYVTLCILFTVHNKLSVANTGDFNHANYTFKLHYITPYSALVIKNKRKKKKSQPTLPIFGGHVTGTRHFLFGIMSIMIRLKNNFIYIYIYDSLVTACASVYN